MLLQRAVFCHNEENTHRIRMPRLFLGNLGHDCRQRDIEKLFDGYGELRNINIKVSVEAGLYYNVTDADDVSGSVRVHGD